MPADYSLPDYGGYARQRRDTEYQYGREAATNAYSRFLSQQRGERDLSDYRTNFQRQFPSFQSSLARRGVQTPGVKSGVAQQAMQRYLGDYSQQYGRQQQDITSGLQQHDLQQANLDAWRQQSLADIQNQEALAVAQDAANLQYLREIYGAL